MLMYSVNDEVKKEPIRQRIVGLESLLDELMFLRMRWDIKMFRMKYGLNALLHNNEESKQP